METRIPKLSYKMDKNESEKVLYFHVYYTIQEAPPHTELKNGDIIMIESHPDIMQLPDGKLKIWLRGQTEFTTAPIKYQTDEHIDALIKRVELDLEEWATSVQFLEPNECVHII